MINTSVINKLDDEKKKIAISDFDLLVTPGNIGFYKGCELTQVFIYNKNEKTSSNFFTLICFDEIETCIDEKSNFLTSKLISLNSTYSFGILQQRISLTSSKKIFYDLQINKLNINNETCIVSDCFSLLPKVFIPKEG